MQDIKMVIAGTKQKAVVVETRHVKANILLQVSVNMMSVNMMKMLCNTLV